MADHPVLYTNAEMRASSIAPSGSERHSEKGPFQRQERLSKVACSLSHAFCSVFVCIEFKFFTAREKTDAKISLLARDELREIPVPVPVKKVLRADMEWHNANADFGKELTEEQFLEDEKKYPLGYGTPDDVANTISFLMSDASKWMTGANLILDGGFSIQ